MERIEVERGERAAVFRGGQDHVALVAGFVIAVQQGEPPTQELDDGNVAMDVEDDGADSELEDILRSGKATISLVPVCFIFSETLLIVC